MKSGRGDSFASSSKLRVGIIGASLSRNAGGMGPIMIGHAQELKRLGHDVVAFGVEDEFTSRDASLWADVPLSVHKSIERRTCYAPSLSKSLEAASLDILHQHGLWLYPSIATSNWRKQNRAPTVISTHGMLEAWAVKNSSMKKRIASVVFERENLSSAACLHCSASEVSDLRDFGLKNPIVVLPNGTDVPTHSKSQVQVPQWMQYPETRRVVLFLGRLHPKKGLVETIRAWSLLRDAAPAMFSQWRLAIAGWDDGGHETQLKKLAQELDLKSADLVFVGPLFGEEKEAALTHSDAFILASHSEGFPMSVLEAWSHALPVFKTRACNIPEGFDQNAAIEISTNPKHICQTLATYLGSSDLGAVGERGFRLVADRFTWPAIGSELLAAYNWILGIGPKPSSILLD